MNAPDRHGLGRSSILGTLSICYAPLIDKNRKAIGTRLTMLSSRPQDRLPVGSTLESLNAVWPEQSAPVLVAPLDATIGAPRQSKRGVAHHIRGQPHESGRRDTAHAFGQEKVNDCRFLSRFLR
jgi:hypothetical protein